MTNSDELAEKHARNREQRIQQVLRWAEYVRTHPDEVWGEQVNRLVNSQLEAARHHEHDRPDPDELRASPLLDGEESRTDERALDDEAPRTDERTRDDEELRTDDRERDDE